MKLLVLCVLYFSVCNGQNQNKIILPQHELTTNIVTPANQVFSQYGFTPPKSTLALPLLQVTTLGQRQIFNPKVTSPTPSQTISANIPVGASYQVIDSPLVSSGSHAYPVQHSVEINHGDYDAYPNIFSQHSKPELQKQNLPPITRQVQPQPLNRYVHPNGDRNYKYPAPVRQVIRPQGFQPYTSANGLSKTQQPYKTYSVPSVNQINVKRPYIPNENIIPQVLQKQYQTGLVSTAPNLPHNFKTVPVLLTPYQASPQRMSVKLPTADNALHVVPKPLPSPLKNLPISSKPVPIPISRKPEYNKEENTRSEEGTRAPEEKRPVEDEESEEVDESEEEDEDDEEDGSYERNYRPRYSHNYHEDTEFDKRRYRPTFDAAKYIFNEYDDEAENERDDDEATEEERLPPIQNKIRTKNQVPRKQNAYKERSIESERRRAQKGRKPHYKRFTSAESDEQEGRESRLIPVRETFHRRKYKSYYK